MKNTVSEDLAARDQAAVRHPCSAMPVFSAASASGVRLTPADGRMLLDGMASWWCVIRGYNHLVLNAVIESQLKDMAY